MRIRTVLAVFTAVSLLAACTPDEEPAPVQTWQLAATPPELVADFDRYPGVGSLEGWSKSKNRWRIWCGTVLVAETTAVTAAHCLTELTDVQFRARFGTALAESGGTVRNVLQVRPHPSFRYGESGGVDLAVVVLDGPVPVTPATILPPNPDTGIDLLGWGPVEPDGLFLTEMKRLSATILPADRCTDDIQPWEICTKTTGDILTGKGDSGAPGTQLAPGTTTLATVGLLSRTGDEAGRFDIYTSVHYHQDWILAESGVPTR